MSQVLLSAKGLKMSFGGVKAVNHVDLDLAGDELLCIIGPNGAGKTTLLNLFTGILRPQAGAISFAGRAMVGRPLYEYARRGIIRKFQVPSVFSEMSIKQNLEVALLGVGAGGAEAGAVDEILELIGLRSQADQTMADELAHGQKQWLEIGMALICRPKVLLLDEPASGMTKEETRKLAEMLLDLDHLSTIVIEHDMAFVRTLNSRTVVMHNGEIIRDDQFSVIEQDPLVGDIYLGRQ